MIGLGMLVLPTPLALIIFKDVVRSMVYKSDMKSCDITETHQWPNKSYQVIICNVTNRMRTVYGTGVVCQLSLSRTWHDLFSRHTLTNPISCSISQIADLQGQAFQVKNGVGS